MLINKNSSDPTLVGSLQAYDTQGKLLNRLSTLDTTSKVAVDRKGVSHSVGDVFFFGDPQILAPLLPADMQEYIVPSDPKKPSMVWVDEDTDCELTNLGALAPLLVQCSGCSTKFVVFVDRAKNVWSINKPNAADKQFTATLLNQNTLVCDNCTQPVTIGK